VLRIAKKYTDLPLIAQVSMHEAGVLQDGTSLPSALKQLVASGADVTGVNCRLGPYHMIQSFEQVPLNGRYLSAYPNASLPDYEDGRLVYPTAPEYFKESAEALHKQGVRLIGGCCGTTPEHIAAVASVLKGVKPVTSKKITIRENDSMIAETDSERPPHLHEIAQKQRSIIVELDPPKKLKIDKYLKGAKALQEMGVDAITLADNSLASPRICNTAMASTIQSHYNVRPLVHIACRDRNIIGLQSHLMGLHTLGINQVLAVTGDPTKIGDFPGATSVYDVSSFDLIHLIKQFNKGISYSGKSLGIKTSFSVAAAFNPNIRHLDRAVLRLEKKLTYGADYFISQPIYSEEQLIQVYEATKHLPCPIYIGVMPLTSSRNAEFLHNEVPGIKLSQTIRNRMAAASNEEEARSEGIAIAKSLIDAAYDLFNGIYLITPFLRYELTVELTRYIKEKIRLEEERKIRNGLHIV
ncbi:MAG: bifunctional homocysteine S-methyltransferase/methylenetetrahydrofolate reductase, partial [Anaerobacillus sp.]